MDEIIKKITLLKEELLEVDSILLENKDIMKMKLKG